VSESPAGSILQINVSHGGVPKRAIAEADVTPLGIAGDLHAHPEIHGGPQRALLLITAEGIDELVACGFPLSYGALGENLTTQGIDRRTLRAGQRYRVGQAVIELTRPRGPCATLNAYPGIQNAIYDVAVKAGDPSSLLWGLSGFYASVVQPGTIRTGDPIRLLDQAV
jgi:MOSC domain-containing protein YiiM